MPPPPRAPIDPAEPEAAEESSSEAPAFPAPPPAPVGKAAASRVWPWRFPRPFELAAYAGALSAFLFIRFGGVLHLGWSSVTFIASSVGSFLPAYLAVGVATQAFAHLLRGESVRGYLRDVATVRWLLDWLRLWAAGAAMIYAYLWLKVSVPLARPDVLFDPELWKLDRLLHFGISPTIFAVELAKGTVLTTILDHWYSYFLPTVQLGFAYFSAGRRVDARRHFLLANALLWIAGAWMYLAVPALGPCYATTELRETIRAEMPRSAAGQEFLFRHYAHLVESRGGFLASFNPSLGVAAMPSLHIGSLWLFALWAKRYDRRLFLPLAVAAGLTWAGSLVSTWHYAIDGYAGMLLAWLAIWLADRLEPVSTTAVGARESSVSTR